MGSLPSLNFKVFTLLGSAGVALHLLGCQPELELPREPQTGLEWVQASARVHDPAGLWPVFAAEFVTEHYLPDGKLGWQERFFFDLRLDSFYREIDESGYLLQQTASPRGCTATWPHPNPTPAQVQRFGLSGDACAAVLLRKRYHGFLLGLPMTALSNEASFGESPSRASLNGRELLVVDIDFAQDPVARKWQLWIDPATKQLQAAHFELNRGGGEWIDYREFQRVHGLLIGRNRLLLDSDTREPLIEQRLRFTN